MKFHLFVIAALLGITIALAIPAFAVEGETIDCSNTTDSCKPLPDRCKCIGIPTLGINGDGLNVEIGSVFTASGGRSPYQVGISSGVTIGYSDSGVTLTSIPACAETATLTMNDACEQTATKKIRFSPPMVVSGPGVSAVGAQYTATGGHGPYTFSMSNGVTLSTGGSTATIVDIPACTESSTLTVEDTCDLTVLKEIQFPSQPLEVNGPEVYAVGAQYSATGGHGPYTWETSCGTIGTTSGIVTNAEGCCAATVTAKDNCNKTAGKIVNGSLEVSGPSEGVDVGSQFSATGGTEPYVFSVDKGGIDSSTGVITSVSCGAPQTPAVITVTVTDACEQTATKKARFHSGVGVWVLINSRLLSGSCAWAAWCESDERYEFSPGEATITTYCVFGETVIGEPCHPGNEFMYPHTPLVPRMPTIEVQIIGENQENAVLTWSNQDYYRYDCQ